MSRFLRALLKTLAFFVGMGLLGLSLNFWPIPTLIALFIGLFIFTFYVLYDLEGDKE